MPPGLRYARASLKEGAPGGGGSLGGSRDVPATHGRCRTDGDLGGAGAPRQGPRVVRKLVVSSRASGERPPSAAGLFLRVPHVLSVAGLRSRPQPLSDGIGTPSGWHP